MSSISSQAKLESLRATLQSLENVQLDEKFRPAKAGPDVSQVEEYKAARDEYLRRRKVNAFLQYAQTYDGEGFQMPEEAPSEAEIAELEARKAKVQQELSDAFDGIRQQLEELREKDADFQSRKEDLQRILEEMEAQNQSMIEDDDAMEDDVDDQALADQDAELVALQARKAALAKELRAVQDENLRVEKSLAKKKTLLEGYDVDLSKVEAESGELEEAVARVQEMKAFYQDMIALTEKLSGIQLEDVRQENEHDIVVQLRLLSDHLVDFRLEPAPQNALRLANVQFQTSTTLQGPSPADKSLQRVSLSIPSMDDLVAYSMQQLEPGEDLRFVVLETVGRISAAQARVGELVRLQSIALTQIGTATETNYQEVVCSLIEAPITIVLRLTLDCPLLDGSVFVDQLVGVGGWDGSVLESIRTNLQAVQWARPTDVVIWLQSELRRLESEAGVVFPQTPKLPVRGNIFKAPEK